MLLLVVGCNQISPLSLLPLGVNTVIFWKDGEGKKYYNNDLSVINVYLEKAITELHHTIDTPESDGSTTKFTSHSENHKFKWETSQYDPEVVCVKCRIDFWGDKQYVELIFKKLDEYMEVKTEKVVDTSTRRYWKRDKRI